MPTIAEIIEIAKISQYLSSNARTNGWLFGNGIDRLLPRKLYTIRKSIEWLYGLDPSDDTLIGTANYLYALCAPYSGQAAIIAATASGGIIVNPSTGQPLNLADISLEFELGVTASPKTVNGVNVTLPNDGDNSITIPLTNILQGSLLLTVGGTPQPTIVTTNSTYTTISYSATQAIITLGPAGTTFTNGNTYLISGLQTSST